MLNALECLAKATQMDGLGLAHPQSREAFATMAHQWRRNAIIARQQDAWTQVRPHT